MGYAQALLQKDVSAEQAKLEKQAKKKGLWGSLGRTLGGIAATALTAGTAAPWVAGMMSAGGTALGGAAGSAAAGKIKGGDFFQADRKTLRGQLSPFGSENIAGALKSGVTAGLGQASAMKKLKLSDKKAWEAANMGKGLGLKESLKQSSVGKNWGKIKQTITPGGAGGYWDDLRIKYGDLAGPTPDLTPPKLLEIDFGLESAEPRLSLPQRPTFTGEVSMGGLEQIPQRSF